MSAAVSKDDQERERLRRQRTKNWVLLAALVTFVVVIYIVSIVRMGGS